MIVVPDDEDDDDDDDDDEAVDEVNDEADIRTAQDPSSCAKEESSSRAIL
jgi:hypothetical protein